MLYTKDQICQLFKMSLATLNRKMNQGLPYVKIGKSVRFEKEKVERWINKK